MAKTREEILSLIKKNRPELTDDEAKQLLETLETYCELVINYTLKNGGDEED
jgi:DNA-directed RNA polymerase subunit F